MPLESIHTGLRIRDLALAEPGKREDVRFNPEQKFSEHDWQCMSDQLLSIALKPTFAKAAGEFAARLYLLRPHAFNPSLLPTDVSVSVIGSMKLALSYIDSCPSHVIYAAPAFLGNQWHGFVGDMRLSSRMTQEFIPSNYSVIADSEVMMRCIMPRYFHESGIDLTAFREMQSELEQQMSNAKKGDSTWPWEFAVNMKILSCFLGVPLQFNDDFWRHIKDMVDSMGQEWATLALAAADALILAGHDIRFDPEKGLQVALRPLTKNTNAMPAFPVVQNFAHSLPL